MRIYNLLFYKLYKVGLTTRSKIDAALVSAFLIGFLVIQWILYILAALNLKDYISKYIFLIAFIVSEIINISFLFRKRRYERIIDQMETNKPPIFFHVLVFLLLGWTFIGILFL
jgi:hypothetical protein